MSVRLLVSCLTAGGVSLVAAQPNPGSQPDQPIESLPPIFAPRPPPKDAQSEKPSPSPPPPLRRAISPEMSAKLSAVATRAAPPPGPAKASGVAAESTPGDSSEAVQLKPYVVQEDRLPQFKDRELLTAKGLLELARRRFAHLGPMTDAAAMRLLALEFAKERRQELSDLKGLLEIDGTKLSPALKRDLGETLMRMRRPIDEEPDFGRQRRPPQ